MGLSKKYTKEEFEKIFQEIVESYKETNSIEKTLDLLGIGRTLYYSYITAEQKTIIHNLKPQKDKVVIGIYKITSPTDRIYIGQSKDIYKRLKSYINQHRTLKRQPLLKKSIEKYRWESHTFEIIEECELEELNCRERYWQDYYDVLNGGLNCVLNECDDKTRAWSEERKESFRGKNNPFYGKSHTKENIKKYKKRVGKLSSFYGRRHTEESKKLMSQNKNTPKKGESANAKPIVSLSYNLIFDCVDCAAEEIGISRGSMICYMAGRDNKYKFVHKEFLDKYKNNLIFEDLGKLSYNKKGLSQEEFSDMVSYLKKMNIIEDNRTKFEKLNQDIITDILSFIKDKGFADRKDIEIIVESHKKDKNKLHSRTSYILSKMKELGFLRLNAKRLWTLK